MFFNFMNRAKPSIEVINLNKQYRSNIESVAQALGMKATFNSIPPSSRRLYVVDFKGDVFASQADALTHEVTSILSCAVPGQDQVLVRLQSPGGAAHAYGYAASQLKRIKDAGISLVVSVDKVAASGGYWMACVADLVISAPYAIVGSIGVVAEFPNFNNFMENLGVNYKQYTAGKFKRTVSTMAKITEEGEAKFKEDLEEMHDLFKDHVSSCRPELDIEKVATGEHWTGLKAKELNLVDEIMTSEEFVIDSMKNFEVVQIRYVGHRKNFADRLACKVATLFNKVALKMFSTFVSEFKYGI